MVRGPLDDAPGVHRDLDTEIVSGAGVRQPAGADVLALGVLADDDQVDAIGVAHLGGDAGEARTGRMFTARSSCCRRPMIRPQTSSWSGTSGRPTAPNSTASSS